MLWWTVAVVLAGDPVARAWNAYELKLWPEAKEEADKALEGKLSKADRSTVLLVSATARQQLGEDADALEAAKQCMELGGRDAEPCRALVGTLALDVGKVAFNAGVGGDAAATERAIAAFQAEVAAMPEGFEGHELLGRALALAKRHDEAIAAFQTAVALDARPSAVGRLLAAQTDAGKLDQALATASAHAMGPEAVHGLLVLGQALQKDRPDEAIAQFRAAVKADGSSTVAHKLLGVALVNSTARAADEASARAALEEGRSELEAALAGSSDDKSVLAALAQVAKALGDEKAAADYAARAQ